jgi:uncharacterized membrane protein HdeD (DUF308 family)
VTSRERWGYAVWGTVAVFVGVTEILARISSQLRNAIPWPTISATVGHLEQRWPFVAVIVLALIAASAYEALTTPPEEQTPGGRTVRKP